MILSVNGWKISPKFLQSVQNLQAQKSLRQVRALVGSSNGSVVFDAIAPLQELLKSKPAKLIAAWSTQQHQALQDVKAVLLRNIIVKTDQRSFCWLMQQSHPSTYISLMESQHFSLDTF